MVKSLVVAIIGLFSSLTATITGKIATVFVLSLMPLLELRGGLIAASLLDLDPILSYVVAVVGNILPVPFILWFMNSILNKLRDTKLMGKIVHKLDKKVENKKSTIEKYGFFGLILFVGIPLPGTGAWTASLVASLLEMDRKKSFKYILIGIILSSIVMMIISFGILSNLL